MAISNKPAGPYFLDNANPLSAGALVMMFDVDQPDFLQPDVGHAVGKTAAQSFYAALGAMSLKTDDPHGVGLFKPQGNADKTAASVDTRDYISISDNGSSDTNHPEQASVPWTKLWVFRPTTASTMLFHSNTRNDFDYNYSNGGMMVSVTNGIINLQKANQQNIFNSTDSADRKVVAGQLMAVAMSFDGTNTKCAVLGLDAGSGSAAASGFLIDKMSIGGGAVNNPRDATTFFMYTHWNDAKSMAELQSLTNDPYQLVGAAAVVGVPSAPSNVVLAAGDGQVSVNWTAPTSDGGAAITSYDILLSNSVNPVNTTNKPALLNAPNDQSVSAQVRAINSAGPGPYSASSNTVTPTTAAGTPTTGGDSTYLDGTTQVTIKTIGIGHSFATTKQFVDAYKNIDLASTNQRFIGETYDDHNLGSGDYYGTNSNANCYLLVRPAGGKGFASGDYFYNTGIKLTIPSGTNINFGYGFRLIGHRLDIQATDGIVFRTIGSGTKPLLQYNRVMCNAANAINLNAYAVADVLDNLFYRTAAVGGLMLSNAWRFNLRRNTFVLLAGGTASKAVGNEYGGDYYDNVFYGLQAFTHSSGNMVNNYANVAQTISSGMVVDTANPFFQNATNDFRAAAALIGKGSADSVSTNDNRLGNRGTSPDVGALQLTTSAPLPIGTITRQEVDGSSYIIEVSASNNPTSVMVSLSPDDPANGSTSQGPFSLVYDDADSKWKLRIYDLNGGNYLEPMVTLTNAGGQAKASGGAKFEIMAVGNLVYDSGGTGTVTPPDGGGTTPPPPAAPTLAIVTSAATAIDRRTLKLNGTVNLQGDTTGKVEYFLRKVNPAGTTVGPVAVTVTGGTNWSLSVDLNAGISGIDVKATANNQTVIQSMDNLKIITLSGNAPLPL